jgi:hypothetical protein
VVRNPQNIVAGPADKEKSKESRKDEILKEKKKQFNIKSDLSI